MAEGMQTKRQDFQVRVNCDDSVEDQTTTFLPLDQASRYLAFILYLTIYLYILHICITLFVHYFNLDYPDDYAVKHLVMYYCVP